MSSLARVVALWLATCALAARAQDEQLIPQCEHPRCQLTKTEFNIYTFTVQGYPLKIYSNVDVVYFAKSESVSFGDPAWPSFPRPTFFKIVDLRCSPPSGSYAATLKALNVTTNELCLTVKAKDQFSTATLADLPESITKLTLEAESKILVLEPNTLLPLAGIKKLNLRRVRTEVVPKHLDVLEMIEIGSDLLPAGALDVTSLILRDNDLVSINAFAPRLVSLVLDTPYLTKLVLHDAASSVLQDGLLKFCNSLLTLMLHHAQVDTIPVNLLYGAPKLEVFSFKNGNITTIPEKLFANNPKLQLVDLSDNQLVSLPDEVFLNLPDLIMVWLVNNQLRSTSLSAVTRLNMINSLRLSENPLSDLCTPNGSNPSLSNLTQLTDLSLEKVGLSEVCYDWLKLPQLGFLALGYNNISTVSCSHIKNVHRKRYYIDVRDNPVNSSDCSWASVPNDDRELPKVLIDTLPNCLCNCTHFKCVAGRVPFRR